MSSPHTEYMQHALRLAARGLYTTGPNPRVGCVLVRDGEIVGTGWHRRAGEPHAEVEALARAGERARGSTAYITLEPCCHTGRTGPCTEALHAAGVERVYAAMQDPNPLVAGKGLAYLESQGIETSTNLLYAQARALNPGFVSRMERTRPFVRMKLAASLDGRTAMASGDSKWITGEPARTDVQRLRARSGAILTGIGTVLQDDPRMDVRITPQELGVDEGLDLYTPLKVVLDSNASMQQQARILASAGDVLQVTAQDVDSNLDCEQMSVGRNAGGLDLHAVMDELARREVNECHVECGSLLAGSLLKAGLVDELVVYIAPHIMGDSAKGMFAIPGLESMADRIRLHMTDVRKVGDDMRVTATIEQ